MVENAGNGANTGESGGKGKKKLRVLLRTFGWPYVTVARDGA